MKLIFLCLVVALCIFCKNGEALFYRLNSDDKIAERKSEIQKRESESFGWEVGAGRGNAAFDFGASGSSSFGDSSFSSKTVEGDQVARSGRSISSDLVETGYFGWEVGAGRVNAALGFGASSSSSFGDSDFSSKTVEGNRVVRSEGSISSDPGGASLRTVSSYVGDSSENLESNLGSSGQQGLEINELGRDGLSGNASVEDELKGFGSDASSSGGNIWSSNSGSGEGNKSEAGLGVGTSGSNISDETGVSGTGITSSSDYSTSGSLSTPEKGSHIPEATPKYSETNAIIGEASTWGKGAYKAFNGRVFSFESSCTYTFCRHCVESGGDFNIEIKRNNDSEIEKITVIIDNNDVSIFGDILLVNGESVQIPYNNKLIHIKKYGDHNVLNSRRGILSLMWDKNNKLSLTLHKQYPTCGLCGNFNSTPGDDINEHIADSKIPGDCSKAVSKSYEVCEDGVQFCNKIIETYFEKCGKVSTLSSDYKMICIDEYCQSRDKTSTCDTYSELSRLCASDGPGTFESWRDDTDVVCEKPICPEKLIYKECGPSNPATCSNVAPFQDIECVSGCTCPEGYLLDDIGEKGRCVLKSDCPCESSGKVYQSGEVREGSCGSLCTCQEAKWSCTKTLCPGRCKIEGSLITTFDGVKYNHPGNCHFLAIHDKDWSISVELRPCPSGQSGTCLNSVTLLLNSSVQVDKYVFNRDGTVTNDKFGNVGYYYSDKIQIFNASSSYLQAETYFHGKMQIQIFPVMQLYVSVPPNQFTDTVGLCGSHNNRAEDDFMSSQNILEKTSQAFASSWEMMPCPKASTASCISIEKERFAERHCGILLDLSGPFASCHSIVDPKPYHEECKKYTCTCENSQDCLCTILGNYVKACAEKETSMVGWRAGLCDQSCPSGLVFKYNVKTCNSSCRSLSERDKSCDMEGIPVDGCTCPDGMYKNNEGNCVSKSQCDCYINDEVMQPGKLIHIDDNKCVCRDGILLCQTPIDLTLQNCSGGAEYVDCRNPKAQRRVDSTCSTRNIPTFDENLPCKRGCYCPEGMVRNSKGNCVFPDDCPCSFGGREYDQGSVTSVGCNKCTCIKGSWNCTQNECQTTCHIYGEGHVRTFDGKSYSFDGLCQYSFIEDYCGRENGTFRILTESVPCCEDGLTCSRKIIVAFQDQNIVLHDGKVTAVKTTESKECELNGNSYSVHTVGLYLILKFLNGITIIWDKNTRISVILDPRWNGQVCGLCGNNNGDLKDDFTTRYSSVAAGTLEFGNSWKTSQECSDTVAQTFPCDSNPYCKAWAVRKCEIIRDSTFRECHNKVDPNEYYDACIEEACACDMEGKYLGFCTAVAMYAEACSAVGVCVTWRKPDLCPVYCDYYNAPGEFSWHYEPCGTVTAKTCKDRVIGQKFSALLEGCYAKCPDSAPYLDENTMKCVSLAECSCFYNDIVPAGGVIQDNCGRTCYCIAGELECGETASTNSTYTVSTTTATSILSTEAALTLVTNSSGTVASIPGITSSSEITGTTLSFLSETLTTGVTRTPFPITSTAGSVGTTGLVGPTFTSSGRISGSTGVSVSAVTETEDGSTGDTGFRAGGTGSPTSPIRGEEDGTAGQPSTGATSPGVSGTPGTAPGSKSTNADSPVPDTTPGGQPETTRSSAGQTTGEPSSEVTASEGSGVGSETPVRISGATGTDAFRSGTSVPLSGAAVSPGSSPGGSEATAVSSEGSQPTVAFSGATGTTAGQPGSRFSSAGIPATPGSTTGRSAGAGTPGVDSQQTARLSAAAGTAAGGLGTSVPSAETSGSRSSVPGGSATPQQPGALSESTTLLPGVTSTSARRGSEPGLPSAGVSGLPGSTPGGSAATGGSGAGSAATAPFSGETRTTVISGTNVPVSGAPVTPGSSAGRSEATAARAQASGTPSPSSGATGATVIGSGSSIPSSGAPGTPEPSTVGAGASGSPPVSSEPTVTLSGATGTDFIRPGTRFPVSGGAVSPASSPGGSSATAGTDVGSETPVRVSGATGTDVKGSNRHGLLTESSETTASTAHLTLTHKTSIVGSGTHAPLSPVPGTTIPNDFVSLITESSSGKTSSIFMGSASSLSSSEVITPSGSTNRIVGTTIISDVDSSTIRPSYESPRVTGSSLDVTGSSGTSLKVTGTNRFSLVHLGTTRPSSVETDISLTESRTSASSDEVSETSGSVAGLTRPSRISLVGSGTTRPSSGETETSVIESRVSGSSDEESETIGSTGGLTRTTRISVVVSGTTGPLSGKTGTSLTESRTNVSLGEGSETTESTAGLARMTRISVAGSWTTRPSSGETGTTVTESRTSGSPGEVLGRTESTAGLRTTGISVVSLGTTEPSSGETETTVTESRMNGSVSEGSGTTGSTAGLTKTTRISVVGSGTTRPSSGETRTTVIESKTSTTSAEGSLTTGSAGGLTIATRISSADLETAGPLSGETRTTVIGSGTSGKSGEVSGLTRSPAELTTTTRISRVASGTSTPSSGMTRTTVTSGVASRTSGLSSGEKETSVTETRTSGPSIEGSQTTGTAGRLTITTRTSVVVSGTDAPSSGTSGMIRSSVDLTGTTKVSVLGAGTIEPSTVESWTTESRDLGSSTTVVSAGAIGTTRPGASGASRPSVVSSETAGPLSAKTETTVIRSGSSGSSLEGRGTSRSTDGRTGTTTISFVGLGTTGPSARGSRPTGKGDIRSSTTVSSVDATGNIRSGGSGTTGPSIVGSETVGPSSGEAGTTVAGSRTSGKSAERLGTTVSTDGLRRTTRISLVSLGTTGPSSEAMWTTQTSVVGLETTRSSTGVLATTSTSAEGSKTTRPSPGGLWTTRTSVEGSETTGSSTGKITGARRTTWESGSEAATYEGTSGKFSKATISGSSHTEATTLIASNSTSGTGLRPEDNTAVAGGQATGRVTGTTKVIPGTTVAPGSSNTESTTSLGERRTTRIGIITGATTGTSERSSPGSKTGNTGAISGTTVAPGSSNTEATTPTEVRTTTEVRTATETTTSRLNSDATGRGIQTGTTGTGSGTTSSPGSFNAEATTFKEHVRTTETRILSGTTGRASGTTVIPESSNTGTSTGIGRQTSTAVVSSRVTGVSESSSPGTSKEAFETTTGPGISTTGSTLKSNRITTSPRISYPETTVVATGEQETENKTGCPTSLSPPPACYGPLGEKKSPGDIWTANCHKCTCTDAETVDCKLKECPSPPTCKPEERLVKFKDNDTCCEIGYCEPRTCLFNNNDYEVGASFADPNNPCISYSCHNTGFVAVVQDCPKQTWCAEEDRVYDSTKCCYTCKPNCRSSSVNVTVNYNGCKKKVEMARCTGECKKTIKYDYDIFQLKNSCLCCQEENYEYREIDLDCPDGGTIPYRYRHIITCSCLDICQQSMTSTVS